MRAVVTGAAGFIGSTLSQALVAAGHSVLGVDAFTDYYDPRLKAANVAGLVAEPHFSLHGVDLATGDCEPLLRGADVVFHLAGQPGVRTSWAHGFGRHLDANVLATQRLLEAAHRAGIARLVYASSSSVYGDAAAYPCTEDAVPAPRSPYGVSKLAGEHLCALYARSHGLATVSLRYFTVFGPRQRPDMAVARMVEAALDERTFVMSAEPGTVRDFTAVDDVVRATLAAGLAPAVAPGTVLNVSGGQPASLAEVVSLVGELLGRRVAVDAAPPVAGDVRRTGGDFRRARELLGWVPTVPLREGLAAQVAWHVARRSGASGSAGAGPTAPTGADVPALVPAG